MRSHKPANLTEALNKWNGHCYRTEMTQAELEAREEFDRKEHELRLKRAAGELSVLGIFVEATKLERDANRKIDQARRSGEPNTVTRMV